MAKAIVAGVALVLGVLLWGTLTNAIVPGDAEVPGTVGKSAAQAVAPAAVAAIDSLLLSVAGILVALGVAVLAFFRGL